jgi:hypothetical protein
MEDIDKDIAVMCGESNAWYAEKVTRLQWPWDGRHRVMRDEIDIMCGKINA